MNHYEFINDAWRTDLLVCSPALFVLVGCPIAIAVAVAHTLTTDDAMAADVDRDSCFVLPRY